MDHAQAEIIEITDYLESNWTHKESSRLSNKNETGYIGKYPSMVDIAILAEPGILTSEEAKNFMDKMKTNFIIGLLLNMGKCWFQSLHVKGPDDQAAKDYFFQTFSLEANMKGNPYAAYYCGEDMTSATFDYWRFGGLASSASFSHAPDEDRNLKLNLIDGVENFPNKVLFIASECNSIIGEDQQRIHMNYFPNADLVVIKNAGHTMFGEQPEETIGVIRHYFKMNKRHTTSCIVDCHPSACNCTIYQSTGGQV